MRPHKPFDTVTKELLEADPLAWLKLAGLPGESVTLEDTNLTTLSADADRMLRVDHTEPYVANIEFQASHKEYGDRKVFRYVGILHFKYALPIESVVFLLRPEAQGVGFSGQLSYQAPGGSSVVFAYRIVRVWEMPVEALLKGDLATLPLAPIADAKAEQLPEVIARMEARIAAEIPVPDRRELWTTVYLLMGLRYNRSVIHELLKGVPGMEESTTYQEILEKGEARGRITEARALLLKFGGKRFGVPDASTQAALEAITSIEELERLADRLLEVESWQELLAR
jgi:predicted transposase YdaD